MSQINPCIQWRPDPIKIAMMSLNTKHYGFKVSIATQKRAGALEKLGVDPC